MRSPPGPGARRVRLGDDLSVTPLDRDDSQQLGGFGALPATHTGAYRRRAAYHCESLPRRLGVGRAVVPPTTCGSRGFGGRVVRPDVDPPAGQPGGQPGILPFPPDSQRKLVVRYGHPGGPTRRVDHLDTERLRGRKRISDKSRRILRPVDNVDLLAVQLAHHRTDPLAHRPDAGALGVHPGLGGPYRDLRPVTGFPRDRGDLHGAIGDLRDLEREQLLHQRRVGPGQADLRAAEALHHVYDHALDPHAVLVDLAGYLLGGGQDGLHLAQVDGDDALLGARLVRLYHPGDQVTVPAGVLPEVHLVGGLPQPLQDHLLGGHRGDPAEVVRSVVVLPEQTALAVQLLGVHRGDAGLAVDL